MTASTAISYHFIGIGGIGMSGLAQLLLQQGHRVSGSDLGNSWSKQCLFAQTGGLVYDQHDSSHLPSEGVVVYSTDIGSDNPELTAARERSGLRLLHRSELLAELLAASRSSCVVTGSHGKTTTTALLVEAMRHAELPVSYSLGGLLLSDQSNGCFDGTDLFIAEGDESDGSFLRYRPTSAIFTNVGSDHLDHYGAIEQLQEAFFQFASYLPSPQRLVWNGDDPLLSSGNLPGISLGRSSYCQAQLIPTKSSYWRQWFDLTYQGHTYEAIELQSLGNHNCFNGAAAFLMALELGAPEHAIRDAFASFSGVARRAQRLLETPTLTIVDDYAHHTNEIEATLQGLRRQVAPGGRLIALFQPHRYSRWRRLLPHFAQAFSPADLILITDIYSAGELPRAEERDCCGSLLLEKMGLVRQNCCYLPRHSLIASVPPLLQKGDLLALMGAGDITYAAHELAAVCKDLPL